MRTAAKRKSAAPGQPRSSRAAATARRAQRDMRYADALIELGAARDDVTLQIDGAPVSLTRLNKVLWRAGTAHAYTRRDYLAHLLHVGPYMLPHLQDRPLTLIRMPDGITGRRFVHFHYEQRLPPFVETVSIFSEKNKRAEAFLLCNNMPTVLWLAHVGALELHAWHSRVDPVPDARGAGTDFASSATSLRASSLSRPDYVVFDIDPYIYSGSEKPGDQPEFNRPAFEQGKRAAFRLKALLDAMGIRSIVKTSGKTGLHVLVPVLRTIDYDAAREFAAGVSRHLAREHPQEITLDWDVTRRTGKVFMDYRMNVRVKTLSAPYSVRGVPGAPVSMPLRWDELETAQPHDFTMANVGTMMAKRGDIWGDMLAIKQDLAKVLAGSA
jgi:bifunctional non-homologous end joining protein LigD